MGIDESLQVRGTALPGLSIQSTLPGEVLANDDPGFFVSNPIGGLVADGVTPLLFKISASAGSLPAGGASYELTIKSVGRGNYSGVGGLGVLLRAIDGGFVQSKSIVRLTPSRPTAYAVFGPVDPEKLNTTYLSGYAPVVADLEVREVGFTRRVSVFRFGIRKPPVALVHGYNVTKKDWGVAYASVLADRGDFLLPVGYGLTNDDNTTDPLRKLVGTLHEELRIQIEQAPVLKNWAWTRYDAVGHSQGGVLLRMLCSENPGLGVVCSQVPAFRNAGNFFRGRFRRVVTIGSPHAGSTLAEMGYQLRAVYKVPFGSFVSNSADYFHDLDRLFQAKFRVGAGSQLDEINSTLQCDAFARLHLVQTTIYGGLAPGANGEAFNPSYYKALYLNKQTPTVGGQRPGLVVAPNGADGVVDVESQEAGGESNHATAITGENIIHADIPIVFDEVADTESSTVAKRVKTLLDGPASEFGSVTIPTALKATMNLRAASTSLLAQAIKNDQIAVAAACFLSTPAPPSSVVVAAALLPQLDQTLTFALQPPSGESPNGTVDWMAIVYGPAAANSVPTSLVTGIYGEQIALTIPTSLQGQIVLRVRFPSTSGKTVLGTPHVVFERPPGNVLTKIELEPNSIQSQIGAQEALAVSGIYDGAVSSSLFTNPLNCTFQSSDADVASVDADGRVMLLGLGTATITATYNETLQATTAVSVLDVAPMVTSAENVPGTVGQTFSYQLTGSQAALSFSASLLPLGLTLGSQTGLISGTPTTEGAVSALVSVTNANGKGSRQMDFKIAGPAGAPTDLELDAVGVSEQKPVGSLVGRLVTLDPNSIDTFTYQLVEGSGAIDNASFAITGDQIFTAAVLNRAVTPSVSIRLRTTDSSGATFEKVIVLPVMSPPAIIRKPDSQTVFTGENAIFAVETTGLEPLSYQWRRNGVELPGAASRILELTSAVFGDAGDYTVTVWNNDGMATSAPAALVVSPTSYGKWASALPQTISSSMLDPTGDYNGDGIVNFLEFAFGVQPNVSSSATSLPVITRDAAGILLTYREANKIEPLNYRILESANLLTWAEHQYALGDVTRIDRGYYTEVFVRLSAASAFYFFKVSVSTQSQ
jgi:triacylglycerol esterase/lipase EstA (alpha/beta hydrolase family)